MNTLYYKLKKRQIAGNKAVLVSCAEKKADFEQIRLAKWGVA